LAVSKRKNIKVIEQEILNMENDFNNPQEAIKTKKKKTKGSYERKPGRGVDTLFRVT
jgi:ribosomal protein L13E